MVKTSDKTFKTAVRILKKGGVIVYPTDTVYGLGVDATNPEAVDRLCHIKERHGRPISIIVSNRSMADKYVRFSKLAEKVFEKFIPGQITIILPLRKFVPEGIQMVSANTGMLGIRIPDNEIPAKLVDKLKNPITTSSANPKGGLSSFSVEQAREQFADRKVELQPDFYFCGEAMQSGKPSTLVAINGNEIQIIREGIITKEEILSV